MRFLDDEGGVALTYTGLRVFDADGQELEASFECAGDRLRLSVDERGARYPLTIDPIAQQAYLKASNSGATHLHPLSAPELNSHSAPEPKHTRYLPLSNL